ncbi:MAG TPA: L,D-transpeptidase [Acidimicrobiales bacterium]
MRPITTPLGATVAAAALALAAGCGGGPAADSTAPSTTAPSAVAAAAESATTTTAAPASPVPGESLVARSDRDVAVFAAPGDGEPATVLPAVTEFGSPRALLVVREQGDWLQVALPERPNGSTGWIPRSDVTLRTVDEAIVVDTAARTLTLLDGGTEVLTTPIAVGTPTNPTPAGAFYVVDKLDTGDIGGPYGRFALGLSAHSEVLSEFAGGDGQVGIHGTDDPGSIGQAVSHGCVRVPNDVAAVLAATVNLGTPVLVT